MACFHPLQAYRLDDGQILFHDKGHGRPMELPCGQCIGCRLERSRQWAMRCVHEASMHDNNCFITLTYNPENLPPDGGLIKKDFQKFMKRLRKFYTGKKIRFYHCGEYGDQNNRPHYHAILFNHNFDDWNYLFDSPSGEPIYTSPILEKIWGHGFVTVGTVTFESAGYVARYCMKKINGKLKDVINEETDLKPYERINSFTGEITEVIPEYSTMSRGGHLSDGTNARGIGYGWIKRYTLDCYPKDFTTVRGIRMQPPKYYDKYLESIDPYMYDDIKSGRQLSLNTSVENTVSRLAQREKVKMAQFKQLKRSL
ncbi:replication initiator protein [Microviridae sp.]|nr:replication initiator protein [Microviridae sp.]